MEPLPPGPFDMIMVDFPWMPSGNSVAKPGKSVKGKYDLMTIPEIKAMAPAIRAVCAPDAILWMWALNNMLPHALDVLQALGFRFCTSGHWVKRGSSGKLAFGTGHVFRGAGEPIIIGKIGKPKTTKSVRSVIEGPRRAHSQKPEEAYAAAERMMPGARRLDLFSRTDRPGWTAWGNQAGTLPLLINEAGQ